MASEFAAGARAEDVDLPLELPFRAVAGGFHFVADAGGDRFAERGFEFDEFVFAFGANVDFEFRFVGDGVDGGAAFDLAEIEGGARVRGNFCVDEADRAADERVDGIGHAEVGPTVAAGAGDEDFEAAGGEGFGGDVIGAGAVEDDGGFQVRAIGFDEGAHAAEIAFAFFADVSDEEDRATRLDPGFLDGARDGDERGEAGAVVGDAGGAQAFAVAADFHFGAGGKDGVEMRGEHYDFFVGGAGEFADDVAGFVDCTLSPDSARSVLTTLARAASWNGGAGISVMRTC